MPANDFGVVVGISRYPSLGDLGGPENDANAFAAWLRAADGGNVPAGQVKTVLSSDFPQPSDPTTEAVDRAVSDAVDKADALGEQAGRLYLFFAGHGFAPSIDESALLMANAARRATGFHVPGRAYANWFRTSALFSEVVLMMDCCREVQTSAPARLPPWNVRIGGPSPRFFFAFATEMSMAARERPSTSNGHAIRGRFSEAILAGLARATDPQGRVTGRSLQAFVFNLLGKEAAESGETALTRQEPKFQLDEAHDIVFVDRGTPYDLTVTFPAGQPATLLLGDLITAVPPVSLDATTALWRLQPGLYLVRSGGSSKVVELLGTGGTVNVTV